MSSGTRELKGMLPTSFCGMMMALTVAATLLWLIYAIPIPNARIILMSALSCTYYFYQATTVWRCRQFAVDYVFVVVMLSGFAVSLLRCLGASYYLANATADDHFLASSALNSPYLMMFAILALLQSITFFLMATRKLQSEMQKMATLDALTGVMNRRAMMESATTIINIAKRKGQPISLIFFDLDKFKDINDTVGHRGGDVVLCHFADLMKCQKRESDILARLGGEEFALILPDTDNKQALVVAKRIHAALNSKPHNDIPDYTASIGISTMVMNRLACDAFAEAIIGQLLKSADDALYVAKKNGRNRIEVAAQVVLSLVVAESA
jgi:diguanylate cyclase (GGDEF)-like protein